MAKSADLRRALGRDLVCVATNFASNGNPIYLSSDSRWFEESVTGYFGYYGRGTPGLESLLGDERARPVLLPGDASVQLYGATYSASDPETYVIRR